MKKTIAIVVTVCILAGVGAYEWRYSDDMQQHIKSVNRDLDDAQTASLYSTGLIGSIQTMKLQIDVGTEIIETHEHVHTLKDEWLARKINKAIDQDGMTVGRAAYTAIAVWPKSI